MSKSFITRSLFRVFYGCIILSTPQATEVVPQQLLTYKEWSFEKLAASVPTSLEENQTLAPLYQQMTLADSYLFWGYLRLYNHTEQNILKNKLTVLRHYWQDKTLKEDLFQRVTSFLNYRRFKEYNIFYSANQGTLINASHISIPTPQEIVDSPFSHLDYGINSCPLLPENNTIKSISSSPHIEMSIFKKTFESLFKNSILNSSALESLAVTFEKISDIQEFNQMTSLRNLHILKINSISSLPVRAKISKISWMDTLYDGLNKMIELQELQFIDCIFTQGDLEALIYFLNHNQTLKVLKLGSSFLEGNIATFYKALAQSLTITDLDLQSNNEIDSPKIISAFSSLLEINISLTKLKINYFNTLGSILKDNQNLKYISIFFISPVPKTELIILSHALTTMTSLEKVDLGISLLDGEGKDFLLSQFCEFSSFSISLNMGILTKEKSHRESMLSSLYKLLETNKIGPQLSLSFSIMDDSDIVLLIQALRKNNSLKWIDLSNNNMTSISAKALHNLVDPTQGALYNSSLQTIDLTGNEKIDHNTYLSLRNATTPCTFIIGSEW